MLDLQYFLFCKIFFQVISLPAVPHKSEPGAKRLVGCIGFQQHFNSQGHIMAVGDAYVFPGFVTPVLTQLFFP